MDRIHSLETQLIAATSAGPVASRRARIVRLLLAKPGRTTAELARTLGTSKLTIERDMAAIGAVGERAGNHAQRRAWRLADA